MYDLHSVDAKFEVGKAITVREGIDVAFIGTGETVVHCLLAAEKLAEEGLNCRVMSMHTLKPLDESAIVNAGRQCRAVITAEEHSIHGGLGEAAAAVLIQAGVSVPMKIVGIPDEDTVTGAQADIFRHYGLTMEGLTQTAKQLLAQGTAR
jgi:transketolase